MIEFVAATTRPRAALDGRPLLNQDEAITEAESLMRQFRMLYPTEETLSTALRGVATYRLSWFDAHLWAYAETCGIPEILSEDSNTGRHYGHVRVVNPFLVSGGQVQELPPLYA
ncbi:MAG: PIN domain-containing protein [Gammaproteobacteria bacterium]|nr:PIN domain-containing protein [Gammaproteobacteria bacterium]